MTLPSATPSPAREDFERFHAQVLGDPGLLEQLRAAQGREAFKALAVELGRAQGLNFTEDDVQTAMNEAKKTWLERRLG